MSLHIIKVGGSLYDWADFKPRLNQYLAEACQLSERVVIVPGGGPFAEVVRRLDLTHRLGEETCHWLALQSTTVAAEFICQLVGLAHPVGRIQQPQALTSRLTVLDPFGFCLDDENGDQPLPHSWQVTTDSIAGRVAEVLAADRLTLIKSTDWPPGLSLAEAARSGLVDGYFPTLARRLNCPWDWHNLRQPSA